ncbi:TerC family protein, partial [Aeromonas hydrophila]
LLSLAWVMRLTAPLFTVLGEAISGRDLILLLGGLFLIGKSVLEIHTTLEGAAEPEKVAGAASGFTSTLIPIAILDIVF